MISGHCKFGATLEIAAPFFECFDHPKQFLLPGGIVLFRRVELVRVISDRVVILEEDSSASGHGCIRYEFIGKVRVRESEDRLLSHELFDPVEGVKVNGVCGLFGVIDPLFDQIVQWSNDAGIVRCGLAEVVGQPEELLHPLDRCRERPVPESLELSGI